MRIGRRLALLAPVLTFCLANLTGCPSRDVSAVEPNQAKEQQKEIPVNLNRDIDILWVIDNSSSMEQEQASLRANFPEFIRVLETIEGGLPNIHMGIISSDVGAGRVDPKCYDRATETEPEDIDGDNGILQVKEDCPALQGGVRYIEDIATSEDGTERQRNYTGNLADQFACMADLGTNGCGFEQHLESVKRALENDEENEGFLRNDAFLAVIFIQDEDDCSARNTDIFGGALNDSRSDTFGEFSSYRCFEYGTDCDPDSERTPGPRDNCVAVEEGEYIESVSTYIDFMKGVKDDPSKVIVAAVTGPTGPVTILEDPDKNDQLWLQPACVVCDGGGDECSGKFGSEGEAIVAAAPAIRMNDFLAGFPQRSTFQNICTYDEEANDVDLSGALTQIALLLKKVVGNPCLDGKLTDTEPSIDGFQPDCRVSDVRDLNLDTEEEFPIPACEDSGTPCFRVVQDASCNTETNLSLEIDRGDQEPPSNTTVVVRCLVE